MKKYKKRKEMKILKTKTIIIIIVILAAIVLITGGILYKEYNIKGENEISNQTNKSSEEQLSQEEQEQIIYEYENIQTQLKQVAKNKLNELGIVEDIEDVKINIISGTENNEYDYTVFTSNYKINFKDKVANIEVTLKNQNNDIIAEENAENIAKNILKKHTFLNSYNLEQISQINESDKYLIAKYKTSKTDNVNHILPDIEAKISLETGDFIKITYLYEEKEKQINESKISITEAKEKAISILEKYGYGKDLKVKQTTFEKIVPNNYFTKIDGVPDAKANYKQNAFIVDIESDSNPIKVYVDPENGEILGAREY